MIISKLQGGLGNQLFQWAYAKSLSIDHNIEFFLDLSFYNLQTNVTKRSYELKKFPNINAPIINTSVSNFIRLTDDFHYRKTNFDVSRYSYFLDGYWQSENYFKKNEELIKKELSLSEEFLKKISNKDFDDSVSLHIRRTDYLNNTKIHPVQTIQYYEEALNIIGRYQNLYVFSDDINWCKQNLFFPKMQFVEGQDNIEDLWFMSLCSNNIIANSSFSWWGAWLNNNPEKKVIAPKNWFGQYANINSSDIVPETWILL
jgi:hypothetical protein